MDPIVIDVESVAHRQLHGVVHVQKLLERRVVIARQDLEVLFFDGLDVDLLEKELLVVFGLLELFKLAHVALD